MMSRFKKPAVFVRRASGESAFRSYRSNKQEDEQTQEQLGSPIPETVFVPKTTQEDEALRLNRAFIAGVTPILEVEKSKQSSHNPDPQSFEPIKITENKQAPGKTSVTQRASPLEDLLDQFAMEKAGLFMKGVIIALMNRVLRSGYVNTENNGKIHLQSFGLGIGMTSIVVMIQPFLVVYLDSWIVLLGKLLKHLAAWVVVGAVIYYVLNPKSTKNGAITAVSPVDHGKQLQYQVTKTAPSSPVKKAVAPRPSRKNTAPSIMTRTTTQFTRPSEDVFETEQDFLIAETEKTQNLERAKLMVESSRAPRDDFEQFMEAARKKEQERLTHQKFVDTNKDGIRRQVAF